MGATLDFIEVLCEASAALVKFPEVSYCFLLRGRAFLTPFSGSLSLEASSPQLGQKAATRDN